MILNGRDFSKSFEVMRAEIEAKIGIKPIKEFGANYAEHYHSGETAIAKLINEAEAHKESGAKGEYKGQVAGAFHRKELGDIDLVWGEVKGKGKEAKGYGLAKIIEKHLNTEDFKAFGEGEAGLINAMSEIIGKGKLIRDGDRATLQYIKDDKIFKIGLKGNWKGEPTHNKWVITVYKDEREMAKTIDSSNFTKGETLPLNSKDIIPQSIKDSITMQNNAHLGSGLISGSVAGIETDENGNIVGFNPQNFVLGFLGGSVASKAISKLYNDESTQRYTTLAIKSIQKDYKSLSENNPAMFAKIMQKFNPRDFLKGKKEINSLSNETFNKELAKAIESALQNGKVETMSQAEFRNKGEFAVLFDSISGKYGIIETPIGNVECDVSYAWNHFRQNTYNKNRDNLKGGFFKTFKDPLFIVEQAREGQSSPSAYFLSHFLIRIKIL